MPLVPFDTLPGDARLWIFGARAPLDEVDAPRLLKAVDGFLQGWKSHGQPLTVAREFVEEHFLVIGVDEGASEAGGCSIDGLFDVLLKIEEGIGTTLVEGGLLYFRDASGLVMALPRVDFEQLVASGDVTGDTTVFDNTLTTVGDYRTRFARRAADGWHARLFTLG